MEWEAVIGLEIHAQLATKSKIFSGASTAFGAEPNTQACAVDLALPGTLPVFNEEALRMAVKFGLAVDAEIGRRSVFDRKNYFYPDLPKGYQTSQLFHPIVGIGHIDITLEDGTNKRIGVTRAHLEEDAGKSLHDEFPGMTGIDLNRAGTPLLEIVSEPDMRSAEEAVAYARKIHSIVTSLGICDGNMAEGSFRCDCNVSVRPKGQEELGNRTETKNINSFRFIEKAIVGEIERQIDLIEDGGRVEQATRLYDADKNEAPKRKPTTIVISLAQIYYRSSLMKITLMLYVALCLNSQMRVKRVSSKSLSSASMTQWCFLQIIIWPIILKLLPTQLKTLN